MSQCRNMLSMGSWESEAQHFQRQTGGWRVRGVQKLLPLVFFLINLKTFPLKTCTFVVFSCILCLLGWLLKWFGINLIQLPIHDRSVAMTVSVLFWWSKRLKTAFDLSRLAKGSSLGAFSFFPCLLGRWLGMIVCIRGTQQNISAGSAPHPSASNLPLVLAY